MVFALPSARRRAVVAIGTLEATRKARVTMLPVYRRDGRKTGNEIASRAIYRRVDKRPLDRSTLFCAILSSFSCTCDYYFPEAIVVL